VLSEFDCSFSQWYCCPGEDVQKQDAVGSNCRSRLGTNCRFSTYGCCPRVDKDRADNEGTNCDGYVQPDGGGVVVGEMFPPPSTPTIFDSSSDVRISLANDVPWWFWVALIGCCGACCIALCIGCFRKKKRKDEDEPEVDEPKKVLLEEKEESPKGICPMWCVRKKTRKVKDEPAVDKPKEVLKEKKVVEPKGFFGKKKKEKRQADDYSDDDEPRGVKLTFTSQSWNIDGQGMTVDSEAAAGRQ